VVDLDLPSGVEPAGDANATVVTARQGRAAKTAGAPEAGA